MAGEIRKRLKLQKIRLPSLHCTRPISQAYSFLFLAPFCHPNLHACRAVARGNQSAFAFQATARSAITRFASEG
jgi:hypothetical protein